VKILHVTPSYEPAWHLGGVVRSVSQLCTGQARLGQDITVFTTDSGGSKRMQVPVNQLVELEGVKVFYFKTDLSLKFAYSRALRNACHQRIRDFDIVNLHSSWNYPAIPAYTECLRQNVPYIIHPHGSFAAYALKMRPFKKWIYFNLLKRREIRHSSAIRYTTEMEKEQTQYANMKVPSFIVPNGINTNGFDCLPDRIISKTKWNVHNNIRTILYLGRLQSGKGLEYLLKAFGIFLRAFPESILILAGPDFGLQAKLKSLITELNISSKVYFTGYVPPEERNSLMQAADLLTLVSAGENFGNVVVEAMLSGVPVLLSEHVGVSREVAADGAGVVVPLEVKALAEALFKMLSEPDRLKVMGEAAAAAARRRYDIKVVARQMATAYQDILTGRRSPELSWSDP
jgi:glycosyltransferase involved in cell wall biosynthesis